MLNELSPMQKSAIYMRYMYEMEYAEIAEILDVTPHAVRKFVSKGLGKLPQQQGPPASAGIVLGAHGLTKPKNDNDYG